MKPATQFAPRDDRLRSRGTILVASKSRPFNDIVSAMVAESGYTTALPAAQEPVWRALARTRPTLVICDCDGPVQTLERLIAEATAQRIPLLLSRDKGRTERYRQLPLPPGVGELSVPASADEFHAAIDAVMSDTTAPVHGDAGVSGATGVRAASS